MSLFTNAPRWIREIPNHLKTHEMCDEAVRMEPRSLEFVPNHFKTKEMCNKAKRREPYTLLHVPDHLITQEMCEEVMRVRLAAFFLFPTALRLKRCALGQLKWIHGSCKMSLIGLRYYKKCGMITIMMMMVVIGMMMLKINFLSGTMDIKNPRAKKQK